MSDLREAFIGYTDCNVELKFDITNIGENQHLGIVTVPNSEARAGGGAAESFSYRVYPIPQLPTEKHIGGLNADFFRSNLQDKVIEGVVSKTNNTTFTFPISSLSTNYFVLITNNSVVDPKVRASNGLRDAMLREVSSSMKSGETFAMFYPKKVVKARRARLTAATTSTASVPKATPFQSEDLPNKMKGTFFNQSSGEPTCWTDLPKWKSTNCVNVEWNLPESFVNAKEWFPIQSNLDK